MQFLVFCQVLVQQGIYLNYSKNVLNLRSYKAFNGKHLKSCIITTTLFFLGFNLFIYFYLNIFFEI